MPAKGIGRCLTLKIRKAAREKTSTFLQGLRRRNAAVSRGIPAHALATLGIADPVLVGALRLELAHRASAGPGVPIRCLVRRQRRCRWLSSNRIKLVQASARGGLSAHQNGSVCWSSVPIVSQTKILGTSVNVGCWVN